MIKSKYFNLEKRACDLTHASVSVQKSHLNEQVQVQINFPCSVWTFSFTIV